MFERERFNLTQRLPRGLYISAKKNRSFLCGGAITSLFSNTKINDFDFYFRDANLSRSFEEDIKKDNFKFVIDTDNAVTYSKDAITVQIIKKPTLYKESAKEIFSMFDFTICMGAYDFELETFILDNNFLYHLARRDLVFNTSAEYPLASLCRVKKYLKRGFIISAAELVKIALKVHSLNLKDYHTLKDQLMGVDTLIFRNLMSRLDELGDTPYTFEEIVCLMENCLTNLGLEDDY